MIWTARLRTDHVVILRASGSRAFRAVALIAAVAGEDSADLAVIAAAVVVDLAAAVIDLVAAGDLAAAALAGSAAAVAGSGADVEN